MKSYEKAVPSEQFFVQWRCGDVTIAQLEDGKEITSKVCNILVREKRNQSEDKGAVIEI